VRYRDVLRHHFAFGRYRADAETGRDKRVLRLVGMFLKAGILTELGTEEDTHTGTPQGGILSPLLANIALSALDDHFTAEYRQKMGTTYQRRRRRLRGWGTGGSSVTRMI
jgi:retron-type reverse transcriptase